jgi:hypothetical protein
MGVSDEAKNVIPLKFLRKIKNKIFFPLVNSIRGHTVYWVIQNDCGQVWQLCMKIYVATVWMK